MKLSTLSKHRRAAIDVPEQDPDVLPTATNIAVLLYKMMSLLRRSSAGAVKQVAVKLLQAHYSSIERKAVLRFLQELEAYL